MPCTIILSTIPGRITKFGMTLHIMGTCLAKKEVKVGSNLAEIKSAVADFGKEVHQSHPDESFYISVRIAKGSRAPNGFNAANQNLELGEKTYMMIEDPASHAATA